MKYCIVICFFLLAACNHPTTAPPTSTPEPAEHPMRKQVMYVHDEAMKHMHEMKKLKKQLQDPELIKGQSSDQVLDAISHLALGDSLMMSWMHEYKEPEDPEALTAFYESEMVKIKRVEKVINESMAQAKNLLNQ